MAVKTLVTADEFEQMPDDDTVQIELDEGELITMSLAGQEHGDIEMGLAARLYAHVTAHKLGRVYTGDTGFRLNDITVRGPDVSFVRQQRISTDPNKRFVRGAPDLAVEIRSPSESFRQLTRKIKQYFAAGCRVVWVVDPDLRQVDVFEVSGAERTLGADDLLEAPELLPGFSVRVGELFG
jgi:Uma2 family endonuclease